VTHKILFSFFPGNCPEFLCYFSKIIVQIKGAEEFLEKLLKDVLPEQKNIPESRRVW
jgi:hypothetical protein